MTNEDIEEKTKDTVERLKTFARSQGLYIDDDAMDLIAATVRAATIGAIGCAYEEAAQTAEQHRANEYADEGLPGEIAASIRTLKDALALEPVAST